MPPKHLAALAYTVSAIGLGCTDAMSPSPRPMSTSTLSPSATAQWAPIAQGVHTAVLPGLDNATVTALNDWDEVVGAYGNQAFRWQLTRGLALLQMPGIHSSSAAGVNNTGQVVVTVANDTISTVGIWSWNDSLRLLPLLSTYVAPLSILPACDASAINDRGIALGTCTISALLSADPTVWTLSGRPYRIPANPDIYGNGGNATPGKAISDAGYIVGIGGPVNQAILMAGFIVSPNGAIAPTPNIESNAVNNRGWSAGYSPNTDFARAMLRNANGTTQDLGTYGQANGLTDDNIVIGGATDSLGTTTYAFVWTPTGGLRRLPGLDATGADETSAAVAINHHHQIVGWIISHGARHSVMWTLPSSTH